MACSAQAMVFVSRASIDVDTDAGEGIGKGLRGDTDPVWKRRDVVELGWLLMAAVVRHLRDPWCLRLGCYVLTLDGGVTTVAKPRKGGN